MKNILYNNNYSIPFFNKIINKRITHLKYNGNNNNNQGYNLDFDENIILPYYEIVSKKIEQNIKEYEKKIIYKIDNKLNYIIKKWKDKLHKNRNHNIVYKIICADCSASYIGETKKALDTKLKEHQNDIKNNPIEHGVISKHRTSILHEINWDNIQILDHKTNYDRHYISEMLHIRTTNNILNA